VVIGEGEGGRGEVVDECEGAVVVERRRGMVVGEYEGAMARFHLLCEEENIGKRRNEYQQRKRLRMQQGGRDARGCKR
jgi:hypothetical protein